MFNIKMQVIFVQFSIGTIRGNLYTKKCKSKEFLITSEYGQQYLG